MTTVLVILSAFCITAYTAAVYIKIKGIPSSISATFYKLDHKLWFGAAMWLTAGLLMPAILESTPGCYQFTAFLACIGNDISVQWAITHNGTPESLEGRKLNLQLSCMYGKLDITDYVVFELVPKSCMDREKYLFINPSNIWLQMSNGNQANIEVFSNV